MPIDPSSACSTDQTRRRLLQLGGSVFTIGTLGVSSASATTSPTTGGGGSEIKPDFGSHLQGVDGGYEDHRGVDKVTVEVGASGNGGNLAFSPAGIWINPGTTVVWEWTGEGGSHNVVSQDGPTSFNSGTAVAEEGTTFPHTFSESEAGITNYQCTQHATLGMKGAVAVGDGVPTVGGQSTNETSDNELNESEIPLEPPEEEVYDQTQTTGESTDNESTDDGATESGTSTSVPGFGVLSSLTALGGVGYLIERRLKSDQSNK